MYNSYNIATIIKATAKEKNIVIKQMLFDCELGSNAMSAMYHGKSIASDSLARIADYLDCSVDYLLGRSEKIAENEEEKQVLSLYRQLNIRDKDHVKKLMSDMLVAPNYSDNPLVIGKLVANNGENAVVQSTYEQAGERIRVARKVLEEQKKKKK